MDFDNDSIKALYRRVVPSRELGLLDLRLITLIFYMSWKKLKIFCSTAANGKRVYEDNALVDHDRKGKRILIVQQDDPSSSIYCGLGEEY